MYAADNAARSEARARSYLPASAASMGTITVVAAWWRQGPQVRELVQAGGQAGGPSSRSSPSR